jgi:D-arabinose 1-dehydrogenase-like Zn-dependent alcohol dehydrogenase
MRRLVRFPAKAAHFCSCCVLSLKHCLPFVVFCSRGGTYNLCPDIQFFATPPVDGSLATYVVHAADFAYKLPENMSYEEGAMCEPLSVGVYSCQRASVQPGHRVAILGAGPCCAVLRPVSPHGLARALVCVVAHDAVTVGVAWFAGPIGLIVMMTARAFGAEHVVMTGESSSPSCCPRAALPDSAAASQMSLTTASRLPRSLAPTVHSARVPSARLGR